MIGRTRWIFEYFSYLALVEYCTKWIRTKWGPGVHDFIWGICVIFQFRAENSIIIQKLRGSSCYQVWHQIRHGPCPDGFSVRKFLNILTGRLRYHQGIKHQNPSRLFQKKISSIWHLLKSKNLRRNSYTLTCQIIKQQIL